MAIPPVTAARFGDARTLSVDVSCDEFTSRVRLAGEVDLSNADLMAAALQFALRDSTLRLVLDVSRVTFFGVSGLRVLLRFREATAQDAVDFVVAAPSPHVMKVLEVIDSAAPFRIEAQSPADDDYPDADEQPSDLPG